MVSSRGEGEPRLRLVALARDLEPTDVEAVDLPHGCLEPSMHWHPNEPRLAVLCAGLVLTLDARTMVSQTLEAREVSGLLGWRGSPPAVVVTRLPPRKSGRRPSVAVLAPAGPSTLWPDGLASHYLPDLDALVFQDPEGAYQIVDLAHGSSSPWLPQLPREWRTIVSSTPDGRWVALLEGERPGTGPDLRLLDTTTGESRLVGRGDAGYRITDAAFCPPESNP
jgi:hypothetical protein